MKRKLARLYKKSYLPVTFTGLVLFAYDGGVVGVFGAFIMAQGIATFCYDRGREKAAGVATQAVTSVYVDQRELGRAVARHIRSDANRR